ncbi:hypothetical protein HYR54_08850 [Candidatus Acetothermia bacterium]|nr:hypothetical protein [Candidatus Acetothermia bacterium]MBI3461029.1 hypothetical protein [Candidatus Acetothermia bacterium]MBI3659986.1 hypothetical protein [Candidatus Acetothermia bacterium]
MSQRRRWRILLITLLFLLSVSFSVNFYFFKGLATESARSVNIYILGGFWHIGIGLDILDASGKPAQIKVWNFGETMHYRRKYGIKQESGLLQQALHKLSLFFRTLPGEVLEWDVLRQPGMTREKFFELSDLKVIIRVAPEQAERVRDWIESRTARLQPDPLIDQPYLKAWYGDTLEYYILGYNCATFVADALFAGGIYTSLNFWKSANGTQVRPVRWLLPSRMISHYQHAEILSLRPQLQTAK